MTTETIDFKEEIANFIFTSKYARFNEQSKRRETWVETCNRVMNMHLRKFKDLDKEQLNEIRWAFDMVKEKKVIPSMRSMQFAGKAVEAHNARIFNCSVRHVDSLRAFAEIFYLLLCGCGVGIGVSKFFLSRLPALASEEDKTGIVLMYVVEDNIEGWADSIEALLNCYFRNTPFTGRKIIFEYSKIRPQGSALKTGGGKAPGYTGLKKCHIRIKALLDYIIEEKKQTHLKSINCYDIIMYAADAVLSGGIRRSATSVIFDKDDDEMMNAKTYFKVDRTFRFAYDEETEKHYGKVKIADKTYDVELNRFDYEDLKKRNQISWFHIEPQRARSNNSVVLLRSDVTKKEFQEVIKRTREFGEPGFVFANHKWQLFNPCFEIGFIPVTDGGQCGVQFCNLSSINGANINTKDDFIQASKAASIIGSLQATYTTFHYLQEVSKELTDSEALLGVSITGIMDNPKILLNPDYQQEAAHKAIVTNKKWSKVLEINEAARVTCVKPEGTSSLVLGSASGIHPHHARRYFRRVQCNRMETVYQFFKKQNAHICEESVWSANKTDEVITFPIEISDKAMVKADLKALAHLKIIKETQENWVLSGTTSASKKPITHNVSCTVIVKEDEWEAVISYIYKHRAYFGAVAFIPFTGDKDYKQAPLEAVINESDEIRWTEYTAQYKKVDYTQLREQEDETTPVDEVACGGGACEVPQPVEVA